MRGQGDARHFVVDKERARIVRRIYRLSVQGLGQHRIAQLLNQQHVPTIGWGISPVFCPTSNYSNVYAFAFNGCLVPSPVVYENMIRANWWGEGLRPIALRILPKAAPQATPEAMIAWYGHRAPLYDAGSKLTPAERDRLSQVLSAAK